MNHQFIQDLICPITLELFTDPINVPCCGKVIDRQALITNFSCGNFKCPMCNLEFPDIFDPITAVKNVIISGLVETYIKQKNEPTELPKHRWSSHLTSILNPKDNSPIGVGELSINIYDSKFNPFPCIYILVCDASGSMGGGPFKQVESALVHIFALSQNNNAIKPVIVVYESTARIININLAVQSQEEINQIIKTLYTGGGTNFRSAFSKIKDVLEHYNNDPISSATIMFLTDGESGENREKLIENYKEMIQSYTNFPITTHAIGFGRNCDKLLLEGLRSAEGIFRYTEPNDDNDSLCHKITSLFEIASSSSRVPIEVIFPNGLSLISKNIDLKSVKMPIVDKSGEYKIMVNIYENYDDILIINSEHDSNLNIKIKTLENKQSVSLFNKYISVLIDDISSEIIELNNNTVITENVKILYISLIEQRVNSLILHSDEFNNQRLEFLSSQLDALKSNNSNDFNIGKLLDSRFASQFAGQPLLKSKNQIQNNHSSDEPKQISNVSYAENNVKYKRNPSVTQRNDFQKLVINHLWNSITPEIQDQLNNANEESINHIDENGNTILHLIAYQGNEQLLKAFIEKFSINEKYINQKNYDDETAVTITIKSRGYHKTLDILLYLGGIIPSHRKDKLEAYAIDNKFVITAGIISNYVSSPNSEITVNDTQTAEFIRYTYDKITSKLDVKDVDEDFVVIREETQPKVNYSPLNFLEIALKKSIIYIVEDVLKRNSNLVININLFLENCIPKTPDAEDTPIYLQLANILLEYSPDLINQSNTEGETPLFKASEKGSLPHVKLFIEKGGEIDKPNLIGNTPLWVACSKRFPCIIEELLSNGSDPNYGNEKGNVPMYSICRRGPKKVAEILIAYGANVNHINAAGDTLILVATRCGQHEVLQILLNYSTQKIVNHVPDFDGFNAMFSAVEQNFSECIKILYDFGMSIEQKTANDNKILPSSTPLHLSAYYDRTNATKTLLELGANPNSLDDEGRTPLHIAVIQQNISIIKLLRNLTNLSILDKSGNTALSYSRANDNISKMLINPGAKILCKLARSEFNKIEELQAINIIRSRTGLKGFLSISDCINIYDDENMTPLMYAAIYSNYNIVKLFTELGADPKMTNSFGLNTLLYVRWIKSPRIIEIFDNEVDIKVSQQINKLSLCSSASNLNKMLLFIHLPKDIGMENSYETTIQYRMETYINTVLNENMRIVVSIQNDLRQSIVKPFTTYFTKNIFHAKIHAISLIAQGHTNLLPEDIISLYLFTSDILGAEINKSLIEFINKINIDYIYSLPFNYFINSLHKLPSFKNETFFASNAVNRNLYKIGETLLFPVFLSTTSLWRVALENVKDFSSKKQGTVFIVKSKTGKFVSQYSRTSYNSEVIFNPLTKFLVKKWYIGDVIALGQSNIRDYSFKIKNEEIHMFLNSNKSLIIELEEID